MESPKLLQCFTCKEFKEVDCFYTRKQGKRGYSSWCKHCTSTKRNIPIDCSCGKQVSKKNISRHLKLSRHKQIIDINFSVINTDGLKSEND